MTQLESNDGVIFKPRETEQILGFTHDELSYLRRRGLIEPAQKGSGRGSDNGYGYRELFVLAFIKELRSLGIETSIIKNILESGKDHLPKIWNKLLSLPIETYCVVISIVKEPSESFSFRSIADCNSKVHKGLEIETASSTHIQIDLGLIITHIRYLGYLFQQSKKIYERVCKIENSLLPGEKFDPGLVMRTMAQEAGLSKHLERYTDFLKLFIWTPYKKGTDKITHK